LAFREGAPAVRMYPTAIMETAAGATENAAAV